MQKLTQEIADLEHRIAHSDPGTRRRVRAQLRRVVDTLEQPCAVTDLPGSVRRRSEADDAVEEMFDNLPV